ncbi:integral membrane protein GPR155 [Nephila pilipes]|uniref:Integral membrane protein GPR155 n=1 Tax=Nephila pilipes TaxID=299642 RepID=A0A8X6PQV3_NEPPI|nr:integral membrane protein GPR155 [Nephila pilipes]
MGILEISLGDTLLPSLVQCFGIIFIGYILGRTKVLKQTEVRGISLFVQYLSLPALIFNTVSTIPFTEVKWTFIASVFVSKTCIFICVALVTMLLTHPHDLGKAGIFALLATQSNDFALGFPLFNALYQNTHPEYSMYLYIVAPIQLLILNTIGFFFLESEKHTRDASKSGKYLYHVLKGTLKNPVVVMTIVGLIWNVTYGQKILPIFDNILKAFSSAFPATALLLVGHTMSITSQHSNSIISLQATLLILTKNLIFPLILQKFSALFLQSNTVKETESYSSFGFLYGILPTAPSVYVYATQYETCIDVATKTIIGSTIFSAPLLFASASVISLSQIGIENVTSYLSLTISYLSSVNIFCCIWLFFIFLTGKRWRSVSFGVTFYLVFAQFMTSLGGILLFFSPKKNSFLFYAQYIMTSGSIYATRMCAFLLAVLLLIIRIRSLCFILQKKEKINILSIVICFILPYVMAASVMIFGNKGNYEPNYQLGFYHHVIAFILTFVCLAGTVICIILQQIYLKRNARNIHNNPDLEHQTIATTSTVTCEDIEDLGRSIKQDNCPEYGTMSGDIYERVCDSRYSCSAAQRYQCSTQVSRYIDDNNEIGTGLIDDEYFLKHIALLIMLGVAMTVSLFVCLWKFILEAVNGIFIELEFLDVIVNYTLGIVCFIVFGLDSKLISSILSKFKNLTNYAPMQTSESIESQLICEQFLAHHFEKCKTDIEQTKVINNKKFTAVFDYSEIANWLLEAGVAKSAKDAEFQIECFLKSHIIEELDESFNQKHFRFVDIFSTNA